jgi:hypothetical protein
MYVNSSDLFEFIIRHLYVPTFVCTLNPESQLLQQSAVTCLVPALPCAVSMGICIWFHAFM